EMTRTSVSVNTHFEARGRRPWALLVLCIVLCTVLIAVAMFSAGARADSPNKVSIRDDRTILVGGEPFFPIGLYYAEEEIADPTGKLLADLHATGFNTVF